MYTNASITIYNRKLDTTTRTDVWHRTVIEKVFWDDTKAYNRLQSGALQADEVNVFIPFDYISENEYISPIEYKQLSDPEGYFTLQTGDKITKGSIDTEVENITELDELVQAFTITSVDTKDFGSKHMRHWEVGGK